MDLDGTLLKSDMLMESFVSALRRAPWIAVAAPFWLLSGRATLKSRLAQRSDVDVATLPYDAELLARLRTEHANGRTIVLATATDEVLARRIADHLGCFTEVMASDGQRNLKGEAKAQALVARYGERGFDYVGEDRHDVPAWKHAREAIVVPSPPNTPRAWLRALRAYQWAKNLLLFVPLLTAHRLDAGALGAASMAFLAFCLAASVVYLGNDLLDLRDDRRHPSKRRRALAAGEVPIAGALLAMPLLAVAAAAACTVLPPAFGALLGAYLVANLAYSSWLKRVALADVFALAGLYTLRIFAGAAAVGVPVSDWLAAFSLFAFFSIALAKRYVEVQGVAARREAQVGGRGYVAGDGPLLAMLGVASASLAVLVLALYVTSPQVAALYRHPGLLWILVPTVLYWLARLWLHAHRGRLDEDPLIFALRDPASWGVFLAVALSMAAAT